MKKTLCIVICSLIRIAVKAQADNNLGVLEADRPDATEASSVVPKGFLQIETGAFYEAFEENSFKIKNTVFNTTLLRYGILDNLELRVGWDFAEQSAEFNGNKLANVVSGFSPLLLGAKIAIAEENGCFPEIALVGHLQLPFLAGSDYRPETTGVDFRFSFSHTLSENSSLGYNIGAEWGGDSPEATYVYTLAYGHSLTDKLGAYVELYGGLPEDNKSAHLWDAGLTYLLSNNVQLDVSGGTGISDVQDIYLSAGISVRIPR